MQKPRVGDVVRVHWLDAWFDVELSAGPFVTECPVVTVGFLLDDGLESGIVRVAGEALGPHGWRAVTHVPQAYLTREPELLARGE